MSNKYGEINLINTNAHTPQQRAEWTSEQQTHELKNNTTLTPIVKNKYNVRYACIDVSCIIIDINNRSAATELKLVDCSKQISNHIVSVYHVIFARQWNRETTIII